MTHKAFVSSTFEDLHAHRRHAIAALRKAGIAVDPMEDWTASTDEPKAFSQDRVVGCDLCVLLVAHRRGHVPDGEHLSITELEYRKAEELAIDTLVFMLDEDAPWPRKFDELDRDPGVRRFRAELVGKRGVSFFGLAPDSLEIAAAISRWLAEGPSRSRAALVVQSVDFKYSQAGRKNRLLLFNGHPIPIFVERMWLMHEHIARLMPTFNLSEIVAANSIREIVSPPFQDDDSAGQSWTFPESEYDSGHIQSLDTNWTQREPGWESQRWPNGDPKFVNAVISYRAGEERLFASTLVWQGFSKAVGSFWR